MNRIELSRDQVIKLLEAWENAETDSVEKKLIEDLFLITETVSPIACSPPDRRTAAE